MWKAINKRRRVFWGEVSYEIPNKYWAENNKPSSSLFAHLRAANQHLLPQRALKFLQRNLKVVSLFYLLAHELLCSGLGCHAVPQGSSVSLLLHIVPGNLPWDERLCVSIKHYLCIILITRKLVSCICSYSWFLSHLFHNNNFERNILKKEMNKHKTCKSGKLMWDFR